MEKMISFDEAINDLYESIKNENFTVFMGAGVSKHVNPKYPIWSGVTKKLKNELKFCFTNDALKVAQKYENKFGYDKLRASVKSLFPETTTDQTFYNELLNVRPTYLITTNWDNMLQNSIYSSLEMYDVIADDSELMNSKLYNKYLKIHGDFQHSKFVLTKKSYNSYSKDFPLTENFVKSILCTTTVLFIGYSLSDKDFQQILNWIHKAAPSLPKFYCALVDGHYKTSNILKYNKNNIKTFIVNNLTDIFKTLNNKNVAINNKNPIKAFYELLKPMEKDNAILLTSIQHFLTNAYYKYPTENIIFLWLQVDLASSDYNKERRQIFRNFLNSLCNTISEDDKEILSKIESILNKANILGIDNEGFMDQTNNNIVFLPTFNLLQYYDKSKYYKNFNFKTYHTVEHKIYNCYENTERFSSSDEIEYAFELNKNIIQNDIKNRNYRKLFISYYNQNIIQQTIYNLKITHYDQREDSIDLYKKFTNLPKKFQNEVFDIYNFVNGNTLQSLQIELENNLKDLINTVKSIKQGGMSFDKNKYNFVNRHKNLNDFILLNHILIDHDFNFIQVEQLFLKISLVRQSINETINLNRNEIYTAIKYFGWYNNEKSLHLIFQENGIKSINLSPDDENWLINIVLPNCAKIYKLSKFGSIKPYFNNLLILLCYCQLEDKNVIFILRYLKNIFTFSLCDSNILSNTIKFINTKISNKTSLFNGESILFFYKIIIKKSIYGGINPEIGLSIFNNNSLCYFLHFGQINKEIFSDIPFISNLINLNNSYDLETKINFYCNQLCMIYAFSTDNCKIFLKPILIKFRDYLKNLKPPYGAGMFNPILTSQDFTRLQIQYLLTLFQIKLINFSNSFYLQLQTYLQNELLTPGYSNYTKQLVNIIQNLKTRNPKIKLLKNSCEKINKKYENIPRICSI